MSIAYEWRGAFENGEISALHAEAFPEGPGDGAVVDWGTLVDRHSLGWVVARGGGRLVGFVNVPWDGLRHAWIQDTMVAAGERRRGVGTILVATARTGAAAAGCSWLHVDFDEILRPFYCGSCGFSPTSSGLMALGQGGDG
jgi:GNAT superfamily N-acetyltransferase